MHPISLGISGKDFFPNQKLRSNISADLRTVRFTQCMEEMHYTASATIRTSWIEVEKEAPRGHYSHHQQALASTVVSWCLGMLALEGIGDLRVMKTGKRKV